MKLKDVQIGSTVKINGNVAEILSHGSMGCRIDILKSKNDSLSLGKVILSNLSEVTIIKKKIL